MHPTGNRLNVFRNMRLTIVTYTLDPSAIPRDWLVATPVVLTETLFTAALVCWITFFDKSNSPSYRYHSGADVTSPLVAVEYPPVSYTPDEA